MRAVKAKWRNGYIYPVKKIGKYPQMYVQRAMHGKYRGITIGVFQEKNKEGYTVSMTIRFAKLLKKRIESCLEEK